MYSKIKQFIAECSGKTFNFSSTSSRVPFQNLYAANLNHWDIFPKAAEALEKVQFLLPKCLQSSLIFPLISEDHLQLWHGSFAMFYIVLLTGILHSCSWHVGYNWRGINCVHIVAAFFLEKKTCSLRRYFLRNHEVQKQSLHIFLIKDGFKIPWKVLFRF